ncbi:hypothetical protein [Vitiosangium sp. GDMCC 1.1324]|uniref:hypothetical protein n=1 Tax=Vitiosangium sp. (strain GDMCC 1.1324) TaxID=2138576 RepID=UPI000D3AE56B|nr:hypothetical protein [Vitiosangium sp. GDMCC 1.1324]PTL77808.1 hypothetical protein DAT35_42135 [Vitiosangium sp. GDMCC 1.1324]
MRIILTTIIAVGMLGCATTRAPVGAGKVFSGPKGEQVAVIPLLPEQEEKALVYVQGTGGEFDGKALLHKYNASNGDEDYSTVLRGNGYRTFLVRPRWGARSHLLNVPGRGDSIAVAYDESRTQALKAKDIYALYEKLKADGTIARLEAFDRPGTMASYEQELAEALKSMNKTCGTSTTVSIVWDSISDEVLKQTSISAFCGYPLSALEKLCDTNVGKQIIREKVRELRCQFGAAQTGVVDAGRVTWTVQTDVPNQEDFAIHYFEKNL